MTFRQLLTMLTKYWTNMFRSKTHYFYSTVCLFNKYVSKYYVVLYNNTTYHKDLCGAYQNWRKSRFEGRLERKSNFWDDTMVIVCFRGHHRVRWFFNGFAAPRLPHHWFFFTSWPSCLMVFQWFSKIQDQLSAMVRGLIRQYFPHISIGGPSKTIYKNTHFM